MVKPEKQARVALTSSSDRLSELLSWHRRLGHPSFIVMKNSMLSFFLYINDSSLHCELCFGQEPLCSYPPSINNKFCAF